jgi:hypothetical protein
MRTHETEINTAHAFSHDHLPRKRMGSVKTPFINPDKTASKTPPAKRESPVSTILTSSETGTACLEVSG